MKRRRAPEPRWMGDETVPRTKKEARFLAGIGNQGKTTKWGGYACFPGTGPADQRCGSCQHCEAIGETEHYPGYAGCRKWADLRGGKETPPRIDRATPACKYWSPVQS